MLENLLESKLKKRLLEIFFRLPERSFSAVELQAITDARKPQLAQALREFVRSQVVSTASKKYHRFFRLNPHFPLYDELKDLVLERGQTIPAEDVVGKKLRSIPNVKLAVLSGVFTLQPRLPVDILLVGDDMNGTKMLHVLQEIEKLVGMEVNYAAMSAAEYDYRRMMSDRLVRDILDYPHLVIFKNLKK